ncbi:uncharacterized protein UV8b_03192 [Ustilaginoidea virens]|uniref:Uncharacterized protein n=1 Tax=Ustilaginoidea virens TaxID=1159556 RepID=A0A8E5MGT9_USTVR|nr:uncharacterized protein UV8b_03192 [Ustilaginoidea virens]QUC18951.1 hypothetical protein UV8b_03192 [Ustilaginoidea virens]
MPTSMGSVSQHVPSPNICGWVEGNAKYPLTCLPGQRCAKDVTNHLVGCCWTTTSGVCTLPTTCLDKESGFGDGWSNESASAMICAGSASPYCKTNVFGGDSNIEGYSLYVCDSDTRPETVYRFTTTSSAREDLPTLSPISSFSTSSTALEKTTGGQTSTLGTNTAIASSATSPATDSLPNMVTPPPPPPPPPSSLIQSSTSLAATTKSESPSFPASPTSIAGVVLGAVAAMAMMSACFYAVHHCIKGRKRRNHRVRESRVRTSHDPRTGNARHNQQAIELVNRSRR